MKLSLVPIPSPVTRHKISLLIDTMDNKKSLPAPHKNSTLLVIHAKGGIRKDANNDRYKVYQGFIRKERPIS